MFFENFIYHVNRNKSYSYELRWLNEILRRFVKLDLYLMRLLSKSELYVFDNFRTVSLNYLKKLYLRRIFWANDGILFLQLGV